MTENMQEGISRQIRKEFFALRNGLIADTLRKGGLEQKYIFGLQLPQIKALAEKFHSPSEQEDAELARLLWSDRECREARLLACHLMPPTLLGSEEASIWASDILTREEADILAFRLLRHTHYASELAQKLSANDSPLKRYTAEAIRRFIPT